MTTYVARTRNPALFAVLAAVFVVASTLIAVPPAGAEAVPNIADVEPWFDWSMPDRYGIDGDRDGLVDMANTPAYVHGTLDARCDPDCPDAAFPTSFEAHLGEGIAPGAFPMVTYEWTLRPQQGPVQRYSRYAPQLVVALPEGPTDVILRVVVDLPFRSFGLVAEETIEISDVLVVAIGDSYASGEGNPERRRGVTGDTPAWGDGAGDRDVGADHAAARRSSLSWPSQVAIDLERSDKKSSVTFVSVAASSATIDKGLLGPQNQRLPLAQVPRVAAMVGEREIDILLVSIGGNDIGFSRIIAGLVDADAWLDPICYENDLDNIWASVADGQWNRASRLSWRISDPFHIRCRTERTDDGTALAGLDRLDSELDRLAASLETWLRPGRVVVMEYPDPTGYSNGITTELCDEIVGDAAPLGLHEINREEQRMGRSEVLDPLNGSLLAAANRHGWDYVSGVVDAFTDERIGVRFDASGEVLWIERHEQTFYTSSVPGLVAVEVEGVATCELCKGKAGRRATAGPWPA
ncbi:MAG: hypothetical protein MUP76_11460, partial [Acidimicrobiia bacterium]|nr:hypothetical protein [Acidimicrobiia bacterium]